MPVEPVAREEQLTRSVLSRCDLLAACTEREGIILRTFLSPAMEACLRLVREWMEAAGMTVALDTCGNLHGFYNALEPDADRLIIASHLDTVPNAGRYDGILGVLIGIALVEALGGKRLPFGIEVIGFSDEEGVRFGLPFLGSRALTGGLSLAHRSTLDADGVSLDQALDRFAQRHPDLEPAALHPQSRAYLEFHIEQGPVLDDAGLGLAVVESIAGQSRATFTFQGRAGHAGTTPMSLRQDALTAAAEWLLAVESMARSTPGLVASTGKIVCEPGAPNIIPGMVRCSLDVRSSSDEVRLGAVKRIVDAAREIADRRRIAVSHQVEVDQASVMLDGSLIELAGQAIRDIGSEAGRLVSGAGHDAMIMAGYLPTAMIFLRSPGGVSHHPEEAVRVQDVTDALRAALHFLDRLPVWLQRGGPTCNI